MLICWYSVWDNKNYKKATSNTALYAVQFLADADGFGETIYFPSGKTSSFLHSGYPFDAIFVISRNHNYFTRKNITKNIYFLNIKKLLKIIDFYLVFEEK